MKNPFKRPGSGLAEKPKSREEYTPEEKLLEAIFFGSDEDFDRAKQEVDQVNDQRNASGGFMEA